MPSDQTYWSQRRAEDYLREAQALLADARRDERLAMSECRACFHLGRGRIVGHAFTTYRCQLGDHDAQHENTGVPKACRDCAIAKGVCRRCLGDFDWNGFPHHVYKIHPDPRTGCAPDWAQETPTQRTEACVRYLATVGALSDGEERRVRARIARHRAKYPEQYDAE